MRTALLLLATLVIGADASAVALIRVTPAQGVTFMETTVQIHGVDLPATTWVRVFFGQREGVVARFTAERITVDAPPQRAGTRVDVRVFFGNGVELTLPEAFVYVETGEPKREEQRIFLVPLRTGDVAGANGSLWRTELLVHNGNDEDVLLLANNCDHPFRTPPCSHNYIPVRPHQTENLELERGLAHLEGTFLYVPRTQAAGLDATMRVRDVSREDEGFGTEVPVVGLDEFRPSIRLLDMPVDARYRTMLRIYGQSDAPQDVVVTIYPLSGEDPIEQRLVRLRRGEGLYSEPSFPFVAAYARLDPMSPAVKAAGHLRVRVHVDALPLPRADPPLIPPVWAFLSVTNSATQQVTTITPHR